MIGKPSSPVTLEKPSYTLGDVNEDGKISVMDIVAISQIMSGQVDSNYNNLAADVNVDGKISVMDIVSVRQMIANKVQ